MKKLLFFMMATTLFFTACQQEETMSTPQDVEDAACKIGFIPFDSMINNELVNGTRAEQHIGNQPEPIKTDKNGAALFRARIARASTGCKTGFGLCDIIILGIPIGPQTPYELKNDGVSYISSLLKYDEKSNQYYTDLLLAKAPASEGIETMPPFMVDEEIETIYTDGDTIRMVLPKGANVYNKDLGENGGYRLYLNKIEE